jgi:hypothetical protein
MRSGLRKFLIFCFLLTLIKPGVVRAQTTPQAILTALDSGQFPQIQVFLDVRDEAGRFIRGLQAENISVLEDDAPLPVQSLRELRPGVQLVVALNPGGNFATRNADGVSRYELLLNALAYWAKSRQGGSVDDMSLLVTQGTTLSHARDSMDWLRALLTTQIDFRQVKPSLDVLFRSVQMAGDRPYQTGMGRAVLFITAPVDEKELGSLENLISQANQQGVRVFVWLVTPVKGAVVPGADRLMQLALQTGGQFFTFSGDETIPNPEDYFEPLRSIYHVVFQSGARSSGTHQLVVKVQTDNEELATAPQSFNVHIQPPNPTFISPVLEIIRQPPDGIAARELEELPLEQYQPLEQELKIIVDFPDGRVRPLTRTTLYIDGSKVAENTAPPFGSFIWDLRRLTTSGPHQLKIEAEDDLGMVGSSIETVVQVTVRQPVQGPWSLLYRNMLPLIILAVVIAGAVVLLVLILGGQLRPRTLTVQQRLRRNLDPVTQPVPVRQEAASRKLQGLVNRLQWPQKQTSPKPYAFLSRLADAEAVSASTAIPITSDELTLGGDPNLASLVLNDPSVEGLHARLTHLPDGTFCLADEGTIAGTWINYTPVSSGGSIVEHGDLVHIGRVGFRFILRQPDVMRKPVVILEEPDRDSC